MTKCSEMSSPFYMEINLPKRLIISVLITKKQMIYDPRGYSLGQANELSPK